MDSRSRVEKSEWPALIVESDREAKEPCRNFSVETIEPSSIVEALESGSIVVRCSFLSFGKGPPFVEV